MLAAFAENVSHFTFSGLVFLAIAALLTLGHIVEKFNDARDSENH